MSKEQIVTEEKSIEQTIREEMIAEKKAPKGEKKPWEERFEEDHAELIAPKAPVKKVEEKPKEIEEPAEKAPEKEEKTEDKNTSEQPAEIEEQPAKEQPSEEEAQPADANKDEAQKEEAYLAEYAKKGKITVEEARDEIAKNKAILAKYNNDPIEVAKAYRLTQSEYDKLKSQSEQTRQTADPQIQQIMANPKGYVEQFVKANSEKLIEEFRSENPAKSRDMDDEQVMEEVRDRGLGILQAKLSGYQTKLKSDSSNKREEYIASINESDRQYIQEIRKVLDNLPDWQVVSPTFEFKDLVRWAKGGADIEKVKKSEFDRGYKLGMEKAKILGEVGQPSPSGKIKQKVISQSGNNLTNYQKQQAREMFGNVRDNEEDMFKDYEEVLKSRKPK